MTGKYYVANIETVPLSNSTVSRCISDMAEYCQKKVIQRVTLSPTFFLQMDETTDVEDLAVLLAFVRHINNFTAEEDLFLCKPLKTHAKGENKFLQIQSFLKSMIYLGKK